MSDFGIYSGKNFLELDIPLREWLVENIIKEKDAVLMVGNEKSGKSVLMQNLICCLTSCSPFIDKWEVKRPVKVTYVLLEGELGDTKDRFIRLMNTLEFNEDLFQLMFLPMLALQDIKGEYGLHWLIGRIQKQHYPDIIIFDPLYNSFEGSMSDDAVVRKVLSHLRMLKEHFNCAIILVHHTHKTRFNIKGEVMLEGDEAAFGSKFFKAWVDHVLFLVYDISTGIRTIYCNTQRGGNIVKQCQLRLIEPDPLYFEILDKEPGKEAIVLNLLMQEHNLKGLTSNEIIDLTKLGRSAFYTSIKQLLKEKVIKKEHGRPTKYSYHKQNDKSKKDTDTKQTNK